jgi:hypothetical protein
MSAVIHQDDRRPKSILVFVLQNLRQNIITSIKEAQSFGLIENPPEFVEVNIPLDMCGLPCTKKEEICCAYIKVKIQL